MKERVLIVGNNGNMGKRYKAVLDYLNIENVGVDIGDEHYCKNDVSHILICTPTENHITCADIYANTHPEASILVEKPIALTAKESWSATNIKNKNVYIVNNWAHVKDDMLRIGQNSIYYNYYQTGPHGLYIDCCQLVYLSKHIEHCCLKNSSPVFDVIINDKNITKEDIDNSYMRMIYHWVKNDYSKLWDITDAISMMEVVELYAEHMGTSTKSTD